MKQWIRTCQECGHKQVDIPPNSDWTEKQYYKWAEHKCKKCKSPALDRGNWKEI